MNVFPGLLLLMYLAAPQPLVPADPMDDGLGMRPRPTLECGGNKRIEKWEAERELRLKERAEKALSGFVHALGQRLGGEHEAFFAAVRRGARERWTECVEERPRLRSVCVAVAARRPGLCSFAGGHMDTAWCLEETAAALALERGGAVLASEDSLSPSSCAGALRVFPGAPVPVRCRSLLWREAIRTNEPAWCDLFVRRVDQRACLAVFSASPASCPPPGDGEQGVVMDRGCREDVTEIFGDPEISEEDGGIRIRIAPGNMFSTPGLCRVEVSRGSEKPSLAPGRFFMDPAPSDLDVVVTPVEFLVAPASLGDEIRVRVRCSWGLEEPGRYPLRGVGGVISW